MSNPVSVLPTPEASSLQADERFAHTIDRREQLYMALFVFWLIPMILWHIGCFVVNKTRQLL
ncbi:MAG: hypothetical protein RLY58_856 [Pseudomonadota bacterium]|jgi:hypothetical protein